MRGQSVAVIGAGPGGLAASVLLQSKGFEVHLFEKDSQAGGRSSKIRLGNFQFDTGPTFFLMPEVLEEIFRECGKKIEDYLELKKVEPMYTLDFGGGQKADVSGNPFKTAEAIRSWSPHDADRFWMYRKRQEQKFKSVLPALKKPFRGIGDYMDPELLSAIPYLNTDSVYKELSRYFEDERSRLIFTFQAKYLGMSPFECPSLFSILPHIEHAHGVWHPVGGCSEVSEVLADLFVELGGSLHFNHTVQSCAVKNGRISSLKIKNNNLDFDHYVMNADFAMGMGELFDNNSRKKYKDQQLAKLRYSCSTFMLYMGMDRKFDFPHHTIFFAQNYRKNVREITEELRLSEDFSFYMHNPSLLDPSMAPEGQSGLYLLLPVPNLNASIDWPGVQESTRAKLLDEVEKRTGTKIRDHILSEKIINPLDWQNDYKVYKGATFNLAHNFSQMLQWRPQNASEEFSNLYIVGGGTHPGSGLPTIFQSGLIASQLIENAAKRLTWVDYSTQKVLAMKDRLKARKTVSLEH